MKTLTVTLHDTDNPGSSLQAYALQIFLIENSINNEIINYTPFYIRSNGNVIKHILSWCLFFIYKRNSRKKYRFFRDNYLIVTNASKTKRILGKQIIDDEYEAVITGSDQLWNPQYKCGSDPTFYLSFVKNRKKIAYAVSMGKLSTETELRIEKYCHDFKWISFREKNCVDSVKELIPRIQIDYVSDPVFLLNRDIFYSIASDRIVKDDYILIYAAQKFDDAVLSKIVDGLNEFSNNMKIVYIGTFRRPPCIYIHDREFGPQDFLSYIINSKYVVTNSFHATAFSILFEKDFSTVTPEINSERILDLLNLVSLRDRLLFCESKMTFSEISKGRKQEASKIASSFGKESGKLLLKELYEKD